MRAPATTEFGFVNEFPRVKTKEGFLSEVREFFKETKGGAVPIGSAAAALGIQKRRMYRFVERGVVESVEFTTPGAKQPTILVPIQEIDRLHREGVPPAKSGPTKKVG